MSRPAAPSAVDRSRPPAPAEQRVHSFPDFVRRRIAGGPRVVAARWAPAPLVALEVIYPAGAQLDPVDRPGLASLTAGLLDEGTEGRSATDIAFAVERLGGRLATAADWNMAESSLRLLAAHLEEGLDLVLETVLEPTFPPDEVERARRHRLTDLLRRRDDPGALAADHFTELVYGGTPYGSPLLGTAAGVAEIDRSTIVDFHRTHCRLEDAVLLAVGDLDPEAFVEIAAAAFESRVEPAMPEPRPLADGPPIASGAPREAPAGGLRIRVVDRPSSAQTQLVLGHPAVPRPHPDWTALSIANTLLGGKFTSRINLLLRERHGYTYGAYSRLSPRLGPGPFTIGTAVATDAAGAAVGVIRDELERLRQEPVGDDELAETQSYILGVFPYTLQTVDGLLLRLEGLTVFGMPDDHYQPERYRERLASVGSEEVLAAARRHLRPDDLAVVAVGPAAELVPQLEPLGGVEVVPAAS